MIAKILSSSASFDGVNYNTDKMDKGTGELMADRNFGALQCLMNLRPEDYKNYLKMVSATNKAVKKPQFHAAISAEGRTYDKHQLTEIAIEWLEKMGYGEQPYLIIFHKDTGNNHVHVVTTRIDRKGKKINSGFENIRAVANLNAVLGIDEKHSAKTDIEKALAYSFSTKAQFMMILECQGYKLTEKDGQIMVIKFGRTQCTVSVGDIVIKQPMKRGTPRMQQLNAILYKYAPHYDYLKEKLGIQLLFHSKHGQKPFGYSIIDHANKTVYKGGDVMPLTRLQGLKGDRAINGPDTHSPDTKMPGTKYREPILKPFRREYYRAMLKAAMENFPDIRQGLRETGIGIFLRDDHYYMVDKADHAFIPLVQLLDEKEYVQVLQAFAASGEVSEEIGRQHIYVPLPTFAPSVDDEATHGRKRRKKKNQ